MNKFTNFLSKLSQYDHVLIESIKCAYELIYESNDGTTITLYRGLTKPFDPKYDLSTISGNEYLVYNHHDMFNPSTIKLYKNII